MMMMMMVVVVMRENATFARDDACMRGARLERLVRWWVTDGDSASVDFFFRGEEGKFEQDLFTCLSVVLVGIEVLVF